MADSIHFIQSTTEIPITHGIRQRINTIASNEFALLVNAQLPSKATGKHPFCFMLTM
jgi:hypothetical protein